MRASMESLTVSAVLRRADALDVLDDAAEPVLDDAAAARLAGEFALECELERLLALVVDVGEADQVRHHFARRVVAAVLALQEHARDARAPRLSRPPRAAAAA